MPKPKRASPATGRGSNGPAPEDYREALATEILDKEAIGLLTERRKRNRKRYEAKGVDLSNLDALYKRRDDPASEVEKWFKGMWSAFSSFFTDFDQLDMFVQKATREAKATFRHIGMMAGLKGEPATPPPNLIADESNEWMDGHHEGATARKNAQGNLADDLAAALKTADEGGVVDGTGGKRRNPKAVAVGAKSKADFAKDNGFEASQEELNGQKPRQAVTGAKDPDATDPLIVDGQKYPSVKAADAARKKSQSEKANEAAAAAGIQ